MADLMVERPGGKMRHLVLLALSLLLWSGTSQAQVLPNIIIMVADDMGIADTSAYLNRSLGPAAPPIAKTLRTPNLDRLAAMGVTFTDVHSTGAVCSPSRYGLLTGRYAFRTSNKFGVFGSWYDQPLIASGRPTIATLLKAYGYSTAAFGKWHQGLKMIGRDGHPLPPWDSTQSLRTYWNSVNVGLDSKAGYVQSILDGPLSHGFDYFFGLDANHGVDGQTIKAFIENNAFVGVPTWLGAPPQSGIASRGPGVADWDQQRIGERYLNRVLDKLDRHVENSRSAPFFFYFAPNANHVPADPPADIFVQGRSYPIINQAKFTDGTDGSVREDMVYENDLAVGMLLDKLASQPDPRTGRPLLETTIFIFTSDNGFADYGGTIEIPESGIRSKKGSIYEGGHRIPFIISWPGGGVPAGVVSHSNFGQIDLYATLAALLGHKLGPDEAEDSANILPALIGRVTDSSFRRSHALLFHGQAGDYGPKDLLEDTLLAVRDHPYVMVIDGQLVNKDRLAGADRGRAVPVRLFDLDTDLHQDTNLLDLSQHQTRVSTLATLLRRFHNQGYSRPLGLGPGQILHTDGGIDLRNDRNGAIGYQFTVGKQQLAVHSLGLWDDAATDVVNHETVYGGDGQTAGTADGLQTAHTVQLFEAGTRKLLASVLVNNANSYLQGEFRYVDLPAPIVLKAGDTYALSMSTSYSDGDMFHHFAAVTAVSPSPTYLVGGFVARVATGALVYPSQLPDGTDGVGNRSPEMFRGRMFVGPNARISKVERIKISE